jgi:hypothetical protein
LSHILDLLSVPMHIVVVRSTLEPLDVGTLLEGTVLVAALTQQGPGLASVVVVVERVARTTTGAGVQYLLADTALSILFVPHAEEQATGHAPDPLVAPDG